MAEVTDAEEGPPSFHVAEAELDIVGKVITIAPLVLQCLEPFLIDGRLPKIVDGTNTDFELVFGS